MGPCDVEKKFHGDYRLLLIMLRRASLTTEIDVGGHCGGDYRIVGI